MYTEYVTLKEDEHGLYWHILWDIRLKTLIVILCDLLFLETERKNKT